jgi:hypothetical protein
VAAVGFAIGAWPLLEERQALELAEVLAGRSSLRGAGLGGRIRVHAGKDFELGDTRHDVSLDADEAAELATALDKLARPNEETVVELRCERAQQRDG